MILPGPVVCLIQIAQIRRASGQVLCEIGKKYSFEEVKRARMTNDALIAMSVASLGFKVLTKNGKDFRLLNEFCE